MKLSRKGIQILGQLNQVQQSREGVIRRVGGAGSTATQSTSQNGNDLVQHRVDDYISQSMLPLQVILINVLAAPLEITT